MYVTTFAAKRTLKSTSHPQSKCNNVIQRAIGFNNFNCVYLPKVLDPGTEIGRTRYKHSINALTGRNDNIAFITDDAFEILLTTNVKPQTAQDIQYKNKFNIDKKAADALIAKAGLVQQDLSISAQERQDEVAKIGVQLDQYINPLYEKAQQLKSEFNKGDRVFLYSKDTALDDYDVPSMKRLLKPRDMHDEPGMLPQHRIPNQSCAIQTLSDLGADVKSMWNDQQNSTDVDRWHVACRLKGLDYRNDNEYIKILGKLGYSLKHNSPMRYDQMDWAGLGDGDYFLGTQGDGGIGHAYGVRIHGGAVTQIFDRQGLHQAGDQVAYAFKKP